MFMCDSRERVSYVDCPKYERVQIEDMKTKKKKRKRKSESLPFPQRVFFLCIKKGRR